MITPKTAQVIAQVAASQARIAAMQVANTIRISNGHSVAYDDGDFFYEAAHMERLAVEVINQ